jgi:hypothetical protein
MKLSTCSIHFQSMQRINTLCMHIEPILRLGFFRKDVE